MGDDLFTMPDDSMNFGADPSFDLGGQQLLPMMPQDPSTMYDPMLPFNPQDPSFNLDLSGLGTGGGNSGASALLRALGLRGMDNGGLGQILMAALGIGSGIFANSQNHRAVDQAIQGLTNANTQATNILGKGNTAFQPYADLGAYAAHGLQNLPLTGIAGNFNSLGTGRGIKLGSLAGH